MNVIVFPFIFGATLCVLHLFLLCETLGIPVYIDDVFPIVGIVPLDYNWRGAVERVSCTL